MAEFIETSKNKYKIIGTLTDDDIKRINSFKNRTTLILENTVGLSSELISKIATDRVVFSIKGGLDYENKNKYRDKKYIDRTYVSPDGLKKIIKYFEYNESLIDPNWNEFEKAMFLYNALVVDMEYAEKYDNILSPGTTERSLNGILYGKLVCAGFALVYKEMLDRIGITNYYQNQKDVHAFNVIEIDGKKYGVDVTWDNNDKKNNNGRCGFGRFGHDPDFYTRHGHQLYKDVDVSDDFEITVLERVYDSDEEIHDLSLLTMDQLNECYSHIATAINNRKPLRYDLGDQSLEIKNRYLPVDTVDYNLKQEATLEYPTVIIMDFLRKRDALQINPQLVGAFSSRKGYLLDIGSSNGEYRYGLDLSLIGVDNYTLDNSGNVTFNDGNEIRRDFVSGVWANKSDMSEDELNSLYGRLNQHLTQYFNKYILDTLKNLDTLLSHFEYSPTDWDTNRAIESANIYSKLSIIVNSRDYLIQLGFSEEEVDNIIQKINNKYIEIRKPYEKESNQKENDLEFLAVIFNDIDMTRSIMEHDLGKKVTDEEFEKLFRDVDYMIKIYEQYVIVGKDSKFKFDDYSISKEELQQLLDKIIHDYQKKKIIDDISNNDLQSSNAKDNSLK